MKKKEKESRIKVTLNAYDVLALEETTKIIVQKLVQLKANFVNPVPLPTKRKLLSLLVAPNRYKAAQEQFEKVIHRRVIFLNEPKKEELENLNRLKLSSAVNIRWTNK